ncbi:flagellar assembly protein T N-terminal domain-containing protein [Motilimonas pumila]|uniref:Flagellar biosynthesis protein FlgT n=1 Tax=Motilimonas pumila TaxID=2303987 RepID=A0A418YBB0_9GAMM|nr:flagellar assembly protein T N-terminal domain-containing protein [Motilimonas pumila]RJG40270.1 hypothetical protein D1Z90_16630 [Motilimonas pumila]
MKRVIYLLLLVLPLVLQPSWAKWFEAQGQAIVGNDVKAARDAAIQDAVKQALLYSGGSIQSLQQVNNGVLEQQSLSVSGGGDIRALKVTNETLDKNTITVTVQVDVFPQARAQQCKGQAYAKSLALVRFKMKNRDQARVGDISELNRVFSDKLNNLMELNHTSFDIRQFINQNVSFDPAKLDARNETVRQQIKALAKRADTQFVLLGSIEDVSVELEERSALDFWVKDPPRHFYLVTYLFDGLSGDLLERKHYRRQATWGFKETARIDLASMKFWRSPYGQSLLTVMDEVMLDTSTALACEAPQAKVIAIRDNKIQINLGRKNGLKVGERLTLMHNGSYTDQFGIVRFRQEKSNIKVKVVELYHDSAVLQGADTLDANNIQLNDYAIIQ